MGKSVYKDGSWIVDQRWLESLEHPSILSQLDVMALRCDTLATMSTVLGLQGRRHRTIKADSGRNPWQQNKK